MGWRVTAPVSCAVGEHAGLRGRRRRWGGPRIVVLGPLLRVSRVYDSMSDTGDRDARVRLEEFLAEASADDLRSLLRHLGDSGGDDERVLHVVNNCITLRLMTVIQLYGTIQLYERTNEPYYSVHYDKLHQIHGIPASHPKS